MPIWEIAERAGIPVEDAVEILSDVYEEPLTENHWIPRAACGYAVILVRLIYQRQLA